jgi:hypothetical protein
MNSHNLKSLANNVRQLFLPSVFLVSLLLSLALSVGGSGQSVQAQMVRMNEVPPLVHKQIPSLPLENTYVSKKTGKIDEKSTLVARLIRYHAFVKRRPVNFRLDWQLTLADYLQVNDLIEASTYPGHDTLRENPLERDRAVILRLSRAERSQLVQVLTDLFQGKTAPRSTAPTPVVPQAPSGGGASLLK